MWRDYLKSYIKHNRASSVSIMAAACIAAFFLSLLCSVFYNLWVYEIERITLEEGGWHARITAPLSDEEIAVIQLFSNVAEADVNQGLSDADETVVDIYFHDKRTIYQDLPLILEYLDLEDDAAVYHELLLSRYLIHDPRDPSPPLLISFYIGILVMVSFSLILIVRNSFELSMHARIHQFGIFSSIGATPKQIRVYLIQEAAALCVWPVLPGTLLGIALGYVAIQATNIIAADIPGRHEAVFQYHPYVLLITLIAAAVTVLISVWVPARKLSKMTAIQAIRNAGGLKLNKRKRSLFLFQLFGIAGELAGNALKAQRKALRIGTVSLMLSFLGFSIMICFTKLSQISTDYTYFAKYQDVWDVMLTVDDTAIGDFDRLTELKSIPGAQDVTLYQMTEGITWIADDWQSSALTAVGGYESLTGRADAVGRYQVKVPVVIMDDESFLKYCTQTGVSPGLDGTIVLNRIWDSLNSNFRNAEYIPFVKESLNKMTLYSSDKAGSGIEVPILSFTQQVPVLREEYEHYSLMHVVPVSLWERISDQWGKTDSDCYIRILANHRTELGDLNKLEQTATGILASEYRIISENRIQEKLSNDRLIDGSIMILGAICVLLAVIGITNVFFNTLGFLRQRKREFAQYMSIGLTPAEMRNIFAIEAFVIAGRPLALTMLLTVAAVQAMTKASYLDPMVFWSDAPFLPIFVFAAGIVISVALAYYIGGKRLMQCNLNETLRDDTLI